MINCAPAVTVMITLIASGQKRTSTAPQPALDTANIYNKFRWLSSEPMIPTARFIQTVRKAVQSARPAPAK